VSAVPDYPDFSEVKGQAAVKRALEVAAAGGHSVLMSGPPGTGKSMLAARFPGILPEMNEDEALETAAVQSLNGGFRSENWKRRPYRSPHHTASAVALVGGGGNPRPGEISLAHHGVLFLDELPEFSRQVLEVLREPLETGHITISRAARQADFPARFQLVAAMNPCPCGYLGHRNNKCRCTPDQVARYRARISGPLLDRIDIQIEVPALSEADLTQAGSGEMSAAIRARVQAAREVQVARQGRPNAALGTKEIDRHCAADNNGEALLKQAIARLNLSARAYHRVLKLARSIADLADSANVTASHIAEAIQYRRLSA
jgi:magnesium chelatase family protein